MSESANESVAYGAFSRAIYGRVGAGRLPVSGSIEVTRRCPLTCVHCYNNLPMSDGEAGAGELTLAEHQRLLDQLERAGTLWLLYTGGEILARRDFLDIYTYAKKKGFLITLFTNGTLVTERVADHLAEWRPFQIEITLYGRTRETYERLTGVPGSFEKCLRGIELIRERKLPLRLKTVAVTVNKHEVLAMQRFAVEELGLEFKFDQMMNPRIDCSQSPLAVRLSAEECVAFDVLDPERMKEWQLFAEQQMPLINSAMETQGERLYQCGGGANSFAIDPYGGLSICVLSQVEKYDLRSGTFEEGWDRFLGLVRERRISRVTKCTSCQLKSLCGMCPANGELEMNDPESPVDFLCRVAHLRAYAFGIAVPPHGECEYCPGGTGYEELQRSAARLQAMTPEDAVRPAAGSRFLPMLSASDGSPVAGGCTSCGSH